MIGQDAGADRLRFVMRFTTALLLARMARWRIAFDADSADAFLIQAALALTLPRAAAGQPIPGIDAPDARRHPVPLGAVAQSTGLSYETVRRRAARLRQAGVLQPLAEGFIVPAAVTRTGPAASAVENDRAALITMLAAMEMQGLHIAAAARAAREADPACVARVALDFAIRCLEDIVAFSGGLVPGLLRVAIAHANTRHLLDDAETSLRHAHEDRPLPDAARRAIGLRALARDTALPFETTRRHVAAMLDADALMRADGGVILPARQLMAPAHLAHHRDLLAHFRRLIGELASLVSGPSVQAASDGDAAT